MAEHPTSHLSNTERGNTFVDELLGNFKSKAAVGLVRGAGLDKELGTKIGGQLKPREPAPVPSDSDKKAALQGFLQGGGSLFEGVSTQRGKDVASQVRESHEPVPTRGIDGPPAVNTGIQNTPAPISQLQDNPSGVTGTPQIPLTPATPDVGDTPAPRPSLAGPSASQTGIRNRTTPGAGLTGSPLNDELRRRLKKSGQQF